MRVYVAAFRYRPGSYDEEFHELNDAVQAAAEGTDGYLGKRSWESPDGEEVLVNYRWGSLDALEEFATHDDHLAAKRRWQEWYDGYDVTVMEVADSYGSDS